MYWLWEANGRSASEKFGNSQKHGLHLLTPTGTSWFSSCPDFFRCKLKVFRELTYKSSWNYSQIIYFNWEKNLDFLGGVVDEFFHPKPTSMPQSWGNRTTWLSIWAACVDKIQTFRTGKWEKKTSETQQDQVDQTACPLVVLGGSSQLVSS